MPLKKEEKKSGLNRWRDRFSRMLLYSPLIVLTASFFVGIIFWGGFNTAMEMTNTETFCISCHEMQDNVYQEFKNTIHFSNRTGVGATCHDCHVPREWGHMVVRKIGATNELFHHFLGSIDTTEKFEAKRLELAESVWRSMKKSDSRECRNCHEFTSMDLAAQDSIASQKHRLSRKTGETCIDCHKGIAHKLPEIFLEQEHLRYEREDRACYECHQDMAHAAPDNDGDEGWGEIENDESGEAPEDNAVQEVSD